MKKTIFSLVAILTMAVSMWAGTPQAFSYQAVVRNAADELVTNQTIGVEVSIYKAFTSETWTCTECGHEGNTGKFCAECGSTKPTTETLYAETHNVTTNEVGLLLLQIGKGTATKGTFASINWAEGPVFIKTRLDLNGGTNYTLTTDQQLLSVPYAEYAYTCHRVDSLINHMNQTQTVGYSVSSSTGALAREFSVSATKQVYFSKGNLQYQASTKTWRFAEHQYDIIGEDNSKVSATYTGWIDLFGWGTSGYHNSADTYNKRYQPYSTDSTTINATYNEFGYGPSTNMTDLDLVGTSANYDWGVYNAISNGGNAAGQWRTLTGDEWTYLFRTRANATSLYFRANVNGRNGLVLLPDDWSRMTWYALTNINYTLAVTNFTTNVYSASDWQLFEAWGAVFLPAAGMRRGKNVIDANKGGVYWSSTHFTASTAGNLNFYLSYFNPSNQYGSRYVGRPVRLVQDVK